MSTIINSNWSASNRLSVSNQCLQRSLNRIARASQNDPRANDDSGQAANFSFSAASRWLAAQSAAADHASQRSGDQNLQQAATILSRIGELKTLTDDPETSDSERTDYEDEFSQLQDTLLALGNDTFAVRRSSANEDSSAETTDNSATEATDAAATEAQGASASTTFTDDFSTADNWYSTSGDISVSDHTLYPNAAGGFGSIQSNQSFSGACEIKFDLYLPGACDSLDVSIGDSKLSNLTDTANISKWGWHSVQISYDGKGTASTYLDGSDTAADTQTDIGAASGQLGLANLGLGSARIQNFSITTTAVSSTSLDEGAINSVSSVASADDLASLDASTVAEALDEVAAYQTDGATEGDPLGDVSLDPSAEEAEIATADEAEEYTASARRDILMENSDALLAQANVSEETALCLLEQ